MLGQGMPMLNPGNALVSLDGQLYGLNNFMPNPGSQQVQQVALPQMGVQTPQLGMPQPSGPPGMTMGSGLPQQANPPPVQVGNSMPVVQPRPPMQRDHVAIQRMQHVVNQKPSYAPPQNPHQGPHQHPRYQGNYANNQAKRPLPDNGVTPGKKIKTVEAEKDSRVEHLRKLLRQKADHMLKMRVGKKPFDQTTAYEISRLKDDFQQMFGYPLEQDLSKRAKLSELVFRHANDIVSLKGSRTRGTMLVPSGEAFVETAAAPKPADGKATAAASAQPVSAPAKATSTVDKPTVAARQKPGQAVNPADTVDLTEDPTEAATPKPVNNTASTTDDGSGKMNEAMPSSEAKLSGIVPIYRRKLFAACFAVTKEAEYLLRSALRREMLKVTLPSSAKTVEQAMKFSDYKEAITKLQYEQALPLLTIYEEIATESDSTWEKVQEVIEQAAQGNILLSNAAKVTINRAGMAILIPSLRGMKAYSTVKDMVAFLSDRLLEFTPSSLKASSSEPGFKLENFKQEFLQKYKYQIDTTLFGFTGLKELMESNLMQHYVEVVPGAPGSWYLKPRLDPITDLRAFLQSQMLLLVDKQKELDSFTLSAEQGLPLDAVKSDFALQYLYELHTVAIGFPDFQTLVSSNVDICVLKEESGLPACLHPSPLFHLKLLLQESVKGVAPAFDEEGKRKLPVKPEDGYNMADILEDFEGIYGYALDLAQFSIRNLHDALEAMQDTCAIVASSDKKMYLFPPKQHARNGFLAQLRAKAGKKDVNRSKPANTTPATGSRPSPLKAQPTPAKTTTPSPRGPPEPTKASVSRPNTVAEKSRPAQSDKFEPRRSDRTGAPMGPERAPARSHDARFVSRSQELPRFSNQNNQGGRPSEPLSRSLGSSGWHAGKEADRNRVADQAGSGRMDGARYGSRVGTGVGAGGPAGGYGGNRSQDQGGAKAPAGAPFQGGQQPPAGQQQFAVQPPQQQPPQQQQQQQFRPQPPPQQQFQSQQPAQQQFQPQQGQMPMYQAQQGQQQFQSPAGQQAQLGQPQQQGQAQSMLSGTMGGGMSIQGPAAQTGQASNMGSSMTGMSMPMLGLGLGSSLMSGTAGNTQLGGQPNQGFILSQGAQQNQLVPQTGQQNQLVQQAGQQSQLAGVTGMTGSGLQTGSGMVSTASTGVQGQLGLGASQLNALVGGTQGQASQNQMLGQGLQTAQQPVMLGLGGNMTASLGQDGTWAIQGQGTNTSQPAQNVYQQVYQSQQGQQQQPQQQQQQQSLAQQQQQVGFAQTSQAQGGQLGLGGSLGFGVGLGVLAGPGSTQTGLVNFPTGNMGMGAQAMQQQQQHQGPPGFQFMQSNAQLGQGQATNQSGYAIAVPGQGGGFTDNTPRMSGYGQ